MPQGDCAIRPGCQCFTRVGSGLIYKHETRLEKLSRYKNSSLLRKSVNYDRKKFYSSGPPIWTGSKWPWQTQSLPDCNNIYNYFEFFKAFRPLFARAWATLKKVLYRWDINKHVFVTFTEWSRFVEQTLVLSCCFRCDQIHCNHCYEFGHTQFCYLSRTLVFNEPTSEGET